MNKDNELIYHAGIHGSPEGYEWSSVDNAYLLLSIDGFIYSHKKWNPICNNDHAFVLAVDLGISFIDSRDEDGVFAEAIVPYSHGYGNKWFKAYYHDYDNDKHAATRFAIVRTPAFIGGMENE